MAFLFIPETYTGFTALDAPALERVEISGLFVEDVSITKFRLANREVDTRCDFGVTCSSINPTVKADVDFSLDGNIWAEEVTVSGVKANAIGGPVYVRFSPTSGDRLGIGTFLVEVEQNYLVS